MNQNTQHTPKKYILILVTTREEYDGGFMIHSKTYVIEKVKDWQLAYAGSEQIDDVKELGEMPEGYSPELLKENEQLKEQVGDLTKSVKYFSDLYHDEDKDHKSTKALNAELIERMDKSTNTLSNVWSVVPDSWKESIHNQCELNRSSIAKAQPK